MYDWVTRDFLAYLINRVNTILPQRDYGAIEKIVPQPGGLPLIDGHLPLPPWRVVPYRVPWTFASLGGGHAPSLPRANLRMTRLTCVSWSRH